MGKRHRQNLPLSPFARSLPLLLIAAAALIPFLPGVNGPFIFDDVNTISQNPALGTFTPGRYFTDPTTFSSKEGNWPYRPLTVLSNAVWFAGFGIKSAAPWRTSQLALHLLNSILVFLLARRVFRLQKGAVFSGLIFAAAPLETQAVLYLAARDVVLALMPMLGAILWWSAATEEENRGRSRLLSAGAGACALIAFFFYEGALALVLWVGIMMAAGEKRLRQKDAWSVPVIIAVAAVAYLASRHVFAAPPLLGANAAIRPEYSRLDQVLIQAQTPWVFIKLLLFPGGLNLLHHPSPPGTLADPASLAALAGLAAAGVLIIVFRSRRTAAIGAAWYFASLLPAMLVALNTPWAEHRSYLALPGLCVFAGAIFDKAETLRKNKIAIAAAACVAVLMIVSGFARSAKWSSSQSLFADAAKKTPDYYAAWNLLGAAAMEEKRCDLAVGFLNRALSLKPEFADAYNTRVNCLIKLGHHEQAVRSAAKAVELAPGNPMYRRNLGAALIVSGRYEEAKNILVPLRDALPPEHPVRAMVESDLRRISR